MQLAGLGKKRNLSEVSSLAHALPLFKVLFLLLPTSIWHTSIEYYFEFNTHKNIYQYTPLTVYIDLWASSPWYMITEIDHRKTMYRQPFMFS